MVAPLRLSLCGRAPSLDTRRSELERKLGVGIETGDGVNVL